MAQTALHTTTPQQEADNMVVGEDTPVPYLAIVDLDNGVITAAASTEPYATQLSYALLEQLEPFATARLVTTIDAARDTGVQHVPDEYLDAVGTPHESSCRGVRRGLNAETGDSFVDWYTFLPDTTRDTISTYLANQLLDRVDTRVMQRYRDVAATIKQVYPQLGKHGLTGVIGDKVWAPVKTRMEAERYRAVKQATA